MKLSQFLHFPDTPAFVFKPCHSGSKERKHPAVNPAASASCVGTWCGQREGNSGIGHVCGVGEPLILGVPVHPKRMIAGPEKLGLQVVLCCHVVDPMQDAMAGSDTCSFKFSKRWLLVACRDCDWNLGANYVLETVEHVGKVFPTDQQQVAMLLRGLQGSAEEGHAGASLM